MAQTVKDSFLDLERHRQLLEDNIEKLRKSMLHWQIWEAEYEGLKEEILGAKSNPTREALLAIGRDYEGDLVTKKEVEELLGLKEPRTAAQVVNLLDRRIDYVEQNVRTVQKQLGLAEDKLAAATIISTPDVRNEEGLPLTEIMEELDDDDNVTSSRLVTPGSAKPQLLEVLEKAGVTVPTPPASEVPALAKKEIPVAEKEAAELKPKSKPKTPKPVKKGVKFAEDTKSGEEPKKSETAKRLEDIMKLAKQQGKPPTEPAIIPTNESSEDAALRREMLQYGMSEVGAVVAELELEEESDWTDGDYDETSSGDEEDAFGRSTGRVVDDELRAQMIALEERLGVRVMQNIGKKASDYDTVEEGIGRVSINSPESTSTSKENKVPEAESGEQYPSTTAKKSVRFSEELDISPAPEPVEAAKKTNQTAPVSDIVERVAPVRNTAPTPQRKASKFKAARGNTPNVVNGPFASNGPTKSAFPLHAATPSTPKAFSTPIHYPQAEETPRTVPTGPEGTTLATTVIEHDTPGNASATEPDEMDPNLMHQEAATEYHRIRNRMIQRQGGFMQEEESEIVPFTEEEGGPRKVSRFKAARLARS